MFSFGRSKKVINIVIDDYIMRIVENNGKDLSSITTLAEKLIPQGTIQNGRIVDEIGFFEFMKEVVQEFRLKNRLCRFFVPQEMVIIRNVTIPNEVKDSEIKQYITMEIGNSIHFPFKDPVFDLYSIPQVNNQRKVTIIAAPEEEIYKYANVFSDVNLKPIAVDMQSLGIYRYFLHQQQETIQNDKVFFLLEISLLSANISIFHNRLLEFHRYQSLNLTIDNWEISEQTPYSYSFKESETYLHGLIENLMTEIERLMNFYRFSIHQGEKNVTDIILTGDFPYLDLVKEAIKRFDLPITILDMDEVMFDHELSSRGFIPAFGLALKGGK